MEKIIYADQILHGYANGHQLLAASCVLNLDDRKRMDELSDLSGRQGSEGFVDYYTGYPIEAGRRYVISKTWYAHEMARPGCVWTHSLIFHTENLCRILDLPKLLNSFRRPTHSNYEAYTCQLPFSTEGEKRFPPYNVQRLQYAIFTICSSATPTYVVVDPPAFQFENELFMVLCSLPREILQAFTFCTMSYDDRRYGDSTFQYQMILKNGGSDLVRRCRQAQVCEGFYSIEKYPYWIQRYEAALLQNTLDHLHVFIRQYGADYVAMNAFSRFSRLYFALSGEVNLSLAEYANSIEALFPEDKSILQKTVELILDDTFISEAFNGQSYMILEIMEMGNLLLKKGHKKKLSKKVVCETPEKLHPYLERYIAGTLSTSLCESVEDIIQALPQTALREASGMDRKICFVLIRRNPGLLLCPDIWMQPRNFQQEMLSAINQELDSEQLGNLLALILHVDTEHIAEDLYRFFGRKLLPVLYRILRSTEPIAKTRLDDWTPILLKNQSLLFKEILNLPNAEWKRELFLKLDIRSVCLTQRVETDTWRKLYHEFFTSALPIKERTDIAIQFFPAVFCTDCHFGDDFIRKIVGTVYQEAKADTLSYDAWNRFQHILPQVEDRQAWDRCLRIRKAMLEKRYPISLVES